MDTIPEILDWQEHIRLLLSRMKNPGTANRILINKNNSDVEYVAESTPAISRQRYVIYLTLMNLHNRLLGVKKGGKRMQLIRHPYKLPNRH